MLAWPLSSLGHTDRPCPFPHVGTHTSSSPCSQLRKVMVPAVLGDMDTRKSMCAEVAAGSHWLCRPVVLTHCRLPVGSRASPLHSIFACLSWGWACPRVR